MSDHTPFSVASEDVGCSQLAALQPPDNSNRRIINNIARDNRCRTRALQKERSTKDLPPAPAAVETQLTAVHITKATEQERHARLQLATQQKAACLQRLKSVPASDMTQSQLNAVHITSATGQERHARLQLAAQQKAACLQRLKDKQQRELVVKNQKSFRLLKSTKTTQFR